MEPKNPSTSKSAGWPAPVQLTTFLRPSFMITASGSSLGVAVTAAGVRDVGAEACRRHNRRNRLPWPG